MSTNSRGLSDTEMLLLLIGGIGAFIYWKGGIRGAAEAAAGAVIDAAGGAVIGTVDTAGQVAGLPPLADITTDSYVARWIIDHPKGGRLEASRWSSAGAFFDAQWSLDEGDGTPPDPRSKIAMLFPAVLNTGSVSGSW